MDDVVGSETQSRGRGIGMTFFRREQAAARAARFGRSTDGATAVEFALVAAPFFFLLGGILEVGVMLFTEYQIQGAVDAAGRQVRTGEASDWSAAQFTEALCRNATGVPDCQNRIGFVVTHATRFADITLQEATTIGAGTRSFSPGGPEQAVAIVVTIDWDFILPQMRLLSNLDNGTSRRLQGISVFQTEPFGT